MTAPGIAFARFFWACGLGVGLGIWYGFLRPLRPRHTFLADSLFILILLPVWIFHSFAICLGDMRLGYLGGLFLGMVGWDVTAGRLLRPVFALFWRGVGKIWEILFYPVKKFLFFVKNLFASAKKWVTIKWNNRRQNRRIPGGGTNGTDSRILRSDQNRIPTQQTADQDGGSGGYRVVYGCAAHTELGEV
jgi:hypothetical protein